VRIEVKAALPDSLSVLGLPVRHTLFITQNLTHLALPLPKHVVSAIFDPYDSQFSKFSLKHLSAPPIPGAGFRDFLLCQNKLRDLGLIRCELGELDRAIAELGPGALPDLQHLAVGRRNSSNLISEQYQDALSQPYT
jgi:hypothetical protein